jgi:penicillin amidase
MLRKILPLLLLIVWLFLLMHRWGTNPRFAWLFHYATSPLQIDRYHEQSTELRESPYGPVQLGIDSLGIPHIYAENDAAAAFATGYLHARDRLFQMEMLMRTVKGQLSELVGEIAVPSDRFWLKFEFDSLAPIWFAEYKAQDSVLAGRFEAYCAGVNEYIDMLHFGSLPLEFHLLDFRPSHFKPENMFYLIRYMDHVLTYNEDDLRATEARSLLGEQLYQLYYPLYPQKPFPIYPDFTLPDTAWRTLVHNKPEILAKGKHYRFPNALQKNQDELSLGSNNWVVGPSKSKTANPILCNDTHLQLALPGTWYEVQMVVNGHLRRGMTIPGEPFIISGYNEKVAWGMTNATWDLVDFYELDTDGEGQYFLDGQWLPLTPFEKVINVRGGEPVRVLYWRSHFGPVDTTGMQGRWIATNWIAQQKSNEGMAFAGLEKANNVAEAYAALTHFMQPPQNFILADNGGQFGLVTAGAASLHRDPNKGVRLGVKTANKVGFTPVNAYLNHFNPERGWTGSTNQEHVNHRLSAYLSTRYEASARGRRLAALMDSFPQLGMEELQQIQLDVVDLEWEILRPVLQRHLKPEQWAYLDGFQGEMVVDAVAPTLFYSFKLRLAELLQQKLHPELRYPPLQQELYLLVAENEQLPVHDGMLAVADLVKEAWDISWQQLTEQLGVGVDQWTYGRFHQTSIQHLTRIPALSMPLFASPGSNRTLNVASKLPSTHAASMRTIIELHPDGPRSKMLVTGGQSGRFNAANYHDQVEDWLQGRYHVPAHKKQFDPADYPTTIRFIRK